MLKAIAVGIIIYITHPMAVQSGYYPDGLAFGILYALGVVGVVSILEKR